MKKFFKDIIDEIKSPSEDAGNVLDVTRKLICVALCATIIIGIANAIQYAFYLNDLVKQLGVPISEIKSVMPSGGFPIFSDIIERPLMISINVFLMVLCIKSIRKNELVKNKIFIVLLLLKVFVPIIFRLVDGYSIIKTINNLFLELCFAGLIGSAFYTIKEKTQNSKLDDNKIRIRNISVFGYLHFALISISSLINFIGFASYINEYIGQYEDYLKEANIIAKIQFYSSITDYIITFFIVCILFLSLIMRIKYIRSLKASINILFIVYIVLSLLYAIPFSLFPSSRIFYLAVFVVVTGYQSKFKVFDNLGTRIFKTTIEKVKKGFDNYLSFKE